MSGHDEDDETWFRPSWEDDDEPAETLRPATHVLQGDQLLKAVSETEDALSRMDATAESLPEALRTGLLSRLVYREASGWLTMASQWIHPNDLALRDLGLTGSLAAAAQSGHLADVLPNTVGSDEFEDRLTIPEDRTIALALALARALRRLVMLRTWQPLTDLTAAQDVLTNLGLPHALAGYFFEKWKTEFGENISSPLPLLHALAGASAWRRADSREYSEEVDLRAGFIVAALMRQSGRLRALPCPLWSARPALQSRMTRTETPFGQDAASITGCLQLVAEGARSTLREISRLIDVKQRCDELLGGKTARSRLPDVLEIVFQVPIVTPLMLSKKLDVSFRTASGLLNTLTEAQIIREATGRKSFRAFMV